MLSSPRLRRSFFWAGAAAWAAVIFALSSVPGSRVPGRFGVLAHFAEYALLGILVFMALDRRALRRAVYLAVLTASAYAVTDELHQLFVPGRVADPADWGVDTLGALTGVLLLAYASRRLSGRRTP